MTNVCYKCSRGYHEECLGDTCECLVVFCRIIIDGVSNN